MDEPERGGEVARPCRHELIAVSTATQTREAAEGLARRAVRAKLAAGARITGPVTSMFWYLGEFGAGQEWRLVLTTHATRYAALEALLNDHHPWGNPEIVAVPIVAGSAGYLDWIRRPVAERDDG